EDAIRNAVSLGGDSDTLACIAGGIAQAFYKKIPDELIDSAFKYLPEEFITVINKFNRTYSIK
ncbi:MAG: ADP-ribosylglycohydrolase family protein, partial [Bacteroidota bacterium]|nr:ADP-ribosylglycohydrolase family protein [Bacteroidota bacterium]